MVSDFGLVLSVVLLCELVGMALFIKDDIKADFSLHPLKCSIHARGNVKRRPRKKLPMQNPPPSNSLDPGCGGHSFAQTLGDDS